MGAEFVLPGSNAVHDVVDRFGLGLWEKGMRYGAREPRGGSPSTARRSPARPPRSQRPSGRPGRPAGVWPRTSSAGCGFDEGAREAIRARLEVSSAATADRVDASALAGLAAHADDVCPSVAGGNQRLALAPRRGARRPGSARRTGGEDRVVGRWCGPRRRRDGALGRPRRARRARERGREDCLIRRCRTVLRRRFCPSRTATPRSSSYCSAAMRRRARCCRFPSGTGRGPRQGPTASSRS